MMHELSKKGLLDLSCLTVTGKTVGENIAGCENRDREVIRPAEAPYSETGGIAVLRGSLAPEGGVVKRSAVAPECWWSTPAPCPPPARCGRRPPS